jgi:DNA-binding NtrC family response regulator
MFLDEIGDMSGALQAKLLQVLQDGEFSRLGGKHDVQVDVRVITATNRDLETAVATGEFREDLYFRLNVVSIFLPPLRERRDEIPFLADHFLKKYAAQYNKSVSHISADLLQQFMEYEWPGNVRQLENLIKRMVVLESEAAILAELRQPPTPVATKGLTLVPPPPLPPVAPASMGYPVVPVAAGTAAAAHPTGAGTAAVMAPPEIEAAAAGAPTAAAADGGPAGVSLKDIARAAARKAERELILRMLTRTRWNRKEAAEILGISYKALLYKIKENGLDSV